ncbi:MAG: N-6 DNA methylase [Candidatus Tenebribacter davisii]|nr:N-6 DNA methylase [Candidatus Tenebribacter davisii]
MTEQKLKGAYYTPKILSDFLAKHITTKYISDKNISILEPSVGDGRFLSSFYESLIPDSFDSIIIDIIDINEKELAKAIKLVQKQNNTNMVLNCFNQNYLQFHVDKHFKYSLIIGNPPYIKKNNLDDISINLCETIHKEAREYSSEIKSNGKIKNIWPAFVKAAIMSLNENGIMCFVLPSDILQIKYTAELRALIHTEFDRVEIFTFNELIFSGVEQDVIALIGVKKVENNEEHGVSFYHVETLDDLKEPRYTEKFSNIHRTSLDKWTNYILNDDELNVIEDKKNEYSTITSYCKEAKVGLVTAASKFFIRSKDDICKLKLDIIQDLVKPIIPKCSVLPGLLRFSKKDLEYLQLKNKEINIILFPNKPKHELSSLENSYINWGEEMKDNDLSELHKRYKMTQRKNWYNVPNVWKSEGMFTKRSHLFPKLLYNQAGVYVTDSFYGINTKREYRIRNLVFSFYNTLTLILAELEGRFYGGGVLELTPNEFKKLIIPYQENISLKQFNHLDRMLRDNKEIEEILSFTDPILLSTLTEEELISLRAIRSKLVKRRLKQ